MAHEPARVAWRSYHDWVLPIRVVQIILAGAMLFLVLGVVLMAVGGGIRLSGLVAAGSVLAGIGGCGLLVCLLLCLHAYFIFNVRDEAVQTVDHPWSDGVMVGTQEIPGYAVINKPSALKSTDTLRRNGGGMKKVTMAPDVALDADVRAPALRSTASGDFAQAHVTPASPNLALASPASPGYRTLGNYAVVDTSGGSRGSRVSAGSSMESFDQRSYAQHQQFQDVHHQKQQQPQQLSFQKHRDDYDIHQQRQQLELHRQHLMQQQQQQQQHQQPKHQQQQAHHFRVQMQPSQNVTFAQQGQRFSIPVQHSPSPSMSSQQSSVFTTGSIGRGASMGGGGGGGFSTLGSSVGTAQTSSSFSSYKIQTQGLQYQSGRPYVEDDDYDNPAERTPMLTPSPTTAGGGGGVGVKGVSFTGSLKSVADPDVPEPAPLQYPSERRPMTFEQQSSSKMSIYDNVLFPYAEDEGE